MKRLLIISALVLGSISQTKAQDQKSMGPICSMSYGGAGLFLPSSGMKKHSMIGNGVNFTAGHFQSLGKPKSMKNGGWRQFGLEAKLIYSKFEKDLHPPIQVTNLKYDDGTGFPSQLSLKYETLKKDPDAFHYLIGPSVYFQWNKFFLQPSLLFGYASVSQESFRFYDVLWPATNPDADTTINFYTSGHETNNGFVVVPGLKTGYRFHKNIAAFASFEYSLGSKQEFSDQVYRPMQGPDPQSVYDYYQMTHGSYVEYNRKGKLRALMINLNLAFTINR